MKNRNQIICLGISFRSAPLPLRERLTVSPEALSQSFLVDGIQRQLNGLAVVSTCNRLELYGTAPQQTAAAKSLKSLWQANLNGGGSLPEEATYFHQNEYAVTHLLRVAAGLDSMVLGEPQILGQVTNGFERMQQLKTADADLVSLFRTAIQVGKRARSETDISRNSVSVSSVGVRALLKKLDGNTQKQILVIGAGETARLALKALKGFGFHNIVVINRTAEVAQKTAASFGISHDVFENLPQLLQQADGVVSTTSSPQPVINKMMCEPIGHPVHIIDLAVPRDVDTDVSELGYVSVTNVDDLQHEIEAGLAAREAEIPAVEAILSEELARYADHQRELAVDPILQELRREAEEIRQREISRTLKHLGEVDPNSLKHIEKLTKSLVTKLLHQPTIQLRAEARKGDTADLASAASKLFNLDISQD